MSRSASTLLENAPASQGRFVPTRIRFEASDALENSNGTRLCIEEYLAVIGEIADLSIRSLLITGPALLRLPALERVITYARQRGIQTAVNSAPGASEVELVIDDHGEIRLRSMDCVIGSVRRSSLEAILRSLPLPASRTEQTRRERPVVVVAPLPPPRRRVRSPRLEPAPRGRHRHPTP